MTDEISYAQSIVKGEIKELQKLEKLLSERIGIINQIVECIYQTKGNIIASGIGKTAYIVQKFVSALLSIKVNAIFLHPVDALHGDLGILKKEDSFIFFSNSGRSPELKTLLPYVKKVGCNIIGVVGKEGDLSEFAQICFVYGNVDEALKECPIPSSSAIVQMAICDVLIGGVLKKKGITLSDFIEVHPGGYIGKNFAKISQVMRSGENLVVVEEGTKIGEVLRKMTKVRAGAACIVDKNNTLIGIFTDGDFRRHSMKYNNILELEVDKLMTLNPKVIKENAYVYEAVNIMREYKIDDLPVVSDDNKLVGLVDIQDVVA
jgi:arabinose-5-phosphate isomerase